MASIDERPNGKWRARYREHPGGPQRARHFDRTVDAEHVLTNVQSHGLNRAFWGLPPSVTTTTLAVGTVVDRLALTPAGAVVARKHLCLTGAADHAVIDGMALSRFAYQLVQLLEPGTALDDAFIAETRRLAAADPGNARSVSET